MTNLFRKSIFGGKTKAEQLLQEKAPQGSHSDDLTSVNVERHDARKVDMRYDDRHRLQGETIAMRWKGQDVEAELVNLSGGGAMVLSRAQPMLWDRVDLTFAEGVSVEGAVRWLRDGRIGVEFAHETQIEADAARRDAVLLETIRRTFPNVVAEVHQPEADAVEVSPAFDPARRNAHRHPLIWSGDLVFNHESSPARLRNISDHGALLDCERLPAEGQDVMLDLGNTVTVFGTVMWARGNQVGLAFAEPFDLDRMAEARPDVASNDWAVPGFLQNEAAASPWDEHWDRATVDQVRQNLEGYLKH